MADQQQTTKFDFEAAQRQIEKNYADNMERDKKIKQNEEDNKKRLDQIAINEAEISVMRAQANTLDDKAAEIDQWLKDEEERDSLNSSSKHTASKETDESGQSGGTGFSTD